MANVQYEGTNVLKYNIDGPSDPLGSNENDRFCKSVNGEAPDEVELWERNDPGPPYANCCPGPVMTSASKSMIVDGQLQVDGRVGNPVDILNNPDFGVYSKKPIVAENRVVDFSGDGDFDTNSLEGTAAYWIGTPTGAIPMTMTRVRDGDDSFELLVPAVRRKKVLGPLPNDIMDAGHY